MVNKTKQIYNILISLSKTFFYFYFFYTTISITLNFRNVRIKKALGTSTLTIQND